MIPSAIISMVICLGGLTALASDSLYINKGYEDSL